MLDDYDNSKDFAKKHHKLFEIATNFQVKIFKYDSLT